MNDNTYDGWKNYETRTVALWIDNEPETYHYWREAAWRQRENAPTCKQVVAETWTAELAAVIKLADQLKKEIQGGSPVKGASVYADLLVAALGEVDWQEIAASLLDEIEHEAISASVILNCGRAQAIDDGTLLDVTETAKEAGVKYPTALTAAVWQKYVAVPEGVKGQDEQGRLWDILWMLRNAILTDRGSRTTRVDFTLMARNDNRRPKKVTLKAVCGPGDDAEPVITVMLPHEY